MADPIASLLQGTNRPKHNFPVTSRYYPVETAVYEDSDGESIIYLKRRFIPPPEHYFSQQNHQVAQSERLDNITAKYLGDSEQFWQVADANLAMQPEELTEESGAILRIPQGSANSGF